MEVRRGFFGRGLDKLSGRDYGTLLYEKSKSYRIYDPGDCNYIVWSAVFSEFLQVLLTEGQRPIVECFSKSKALPSSARQAAAEILRDECAFRKKNRIDEEQTLCNIVKDLEVVGIEEKDLKNFRVAILPRDHNRVLKTIEMLLRVYHTLINKEGETDAFAKSVALDLKKIVNQYVAVYRGLRKSSGDGPSTFQSIICCGDLVTPRGLDEARSIIIKDLLNYYKGNIQYDRELRKIRRNREFSTFFSQEANEGRGLVHRLLTHRFPVVVEQDGIKVDKFIHEVVDDAAMSVIHPDGRIEKCTGLLDDNVERDSFGNPVPKDEEYKPRVPNNDISQLIRDMDDCQPVPSDGMNDMLSEHLGSPPEYSDVVQTPHIDYIPHVNHTMKKKKKKPVISSRLHR